MRKRDKEKGGSRKIARDAELVTRTRIQTRALGKSDGREWTTKKEGERETDRERRRLCI